MNKTNKKSKSKLTKKKLRSKRPIHKKVLLHPISIFFLLCTGVLLASITYKTLAVSYVVKATVPADPLTQAATITSPVNNKHFKVKNITVTGTCPADSYVKLFINDLFGGVSICSAGQYTIQTSLSKGANKLKVQAYNITDAPGPTTPSITVYYDIPVPPTTEKPIPTIESSFKEKRLEPTRIREVSDAEFHIESDYNYQVFIQGETFNIPIRPVGGSPPYSLRVKWGDGKETTYVRKDQSSFDIKHVYGENSSKNNNYVILIYGTDYLGNTALLQLSAVSKSSTSPFVVSNISGPDSFFVNFNKRILVYLWPGYFLVLLMVASFYLGERQEHDKYFRHKGLRRRHT